MAVWKWHYHMNVTFFLFSGNWIGKYSCWINTVSFWWDKAHSIAMKKNTGEVKEASYRCTEMKPKPDTVHMVNKLTLRLWSLWRGCPKPLLSSRNSVLYRWLILLVLFSGIYESLLSGMTESIKHWSNSLSRGTELSFIWVIIGTVTWLCRYPHFGDRCELISCWRYMQRNLLWLCTQCQHLPPMLWRWLWLSPCTRKSLLWTQLSEVHGE